ncbi:MAG: serine protease [Acidobacteriota bacterium]
MIADDLFLTAGHCFNPKQEKGWICPSRKGVTITPAEIAPLMQVNFKWQYEGHTQNLRPTDSFPVVELLECEWLGLDYAIVRIGRNGNNQLPNYRTLTVARQDVTTKGEMLCIIQHGAKTPKRVATGPMTDNRAGIISYDTLDTYGGASGAPIFGEAGSIVGVHTNGDCAQGANYGQAIGAILKVSKLIP